MTTRPAARRTRSARGALTILAMFALGGAVLWGLFQAKRATSPPSPGVPWGVPQRVLRVAALDCGWVEGGPPGMMPEDVLRDLRPRDADFVLLRRVRSEDAIGFADGLNLQHSFHPRLFQALGRRPRGPIGCLILSKHPLYDAAPLRREGEDAACHGVRATAVVDGVRFGIEVGEGDLQSTPDTEPRGGASPPVIRVAGPVELDLRTGGAWDVETREVLVARGKGRGLWAALVPAKRPEHGRQAEGVRR